MKRNYLKNITLKMKVIIVFVIFFNLFTYDNTYSADVNDYTRLGGDILSHSRNKKVAILGNLLSFASKFNLFSWDEPLFCSIKNGIFSDTLFCWTSESGYKEIHNKKLGLFLFYNKGNKREINYIPYNKLYFRHDSQVFQFDTSDRGLEYVFLGEQGGKVLGRTKRNRNPYELGDFANLNSSDKSYIKKNYY